MTQTNNADNKNGRHNNGVQHKGSIVGGACEGSFCTVGGSTVIIIHVYRSKIEHYMTTFHTSFIFDGIIVTSVIAEVNIRRIQIGMQIIRASLYIIYKRSKDLENRGEEKRNTAKGLRKKDLTNQSGVRILITTNLTKGGRSMRKLLLNNSMMMRCTVFGHVIER